MALWEGGELERVARGLPCWRGLNSGMFESPTTWQIYKF